MTTLWCSICVTMPKAHGRGIVNRWVHAQDILYKRRKCYHGWARIYTLCMDNNYMDWGEWQKEIIMWGGKREEGGRRKVGREAETLKIGWGGLWWSVSASRRCLRYQTRHRSKCRYPGLKQVPGSHVLFCRWLWNVLAHDEALKSDIMLCRIWHHAVFKHVSSRTWPAKIPHGALPAAKIPHSSI